MKKIEVFEEKNEVGLIAGAVACAVACTLTEGVGTVVVFSAGVAAPV